MTSKLPWTPWRDVVRLREDLKSGALTLAEFAADLYEVVMERGSKTYREPAEFFALTYPTYNLRELAKDVVLRLAGKNDKAVRQLELTYGGGKTHTLITLYHLVNDPSRLPELSAVQEFVQHIGMAPPPTRVAALCFDKLDVEKGMEVRAPSGEKRWLKQPWSVLAFQLAGAEGLRLIHAEGQDAERDSAPAENLLINILSLPGAEGRATLVLIDEVLLYAREKIGLDPAWRGRLASFFQYLTQAATKVNCCAIVASLLASDVRAGDALGKEITHELAAIFRREREEGVQPVLKEDVAEILRRRFFTPDSLRDREAFRPHVVAALKGIADLDEQTAKEGKSAEERFLKSYPFHPDLTEVFYSKWTNLEGFQRTRGVLRTFALALRAAAPWDEAPLVGVNVFLAEPAAEGVSEAARELANIAGSEEYEGKKQEWTGILEGELTKARAIERDLPGLRQCELEQAVFATFLHSQPIGRKVLTPELLVLLGQTRPDKIDLEQGLRRWSEESWFLDEGVVSDAEAGPDGQKLLPKAWRLGSRPNLKQMHHDACSRVADLVEPQLLEEIRTQKSLTAGASAAGARVHNLPERPRDIEDDADFHFAILGPKAASDAGKPSAEAKRFLDETTAPDRPRVYRNAAVLAVPSPDGLDAARNRVREHLGWEEVRTQLKDQPLDPLREQMLAANVDGAKKKLPGAIRDAYNVVVTVGEGNEVAAFKVAAGDEPLFTRIKKEERARIKETAISAEALLPGGPYDLWREGETARRVKDLVTAFAQFPRLPKMLKSQAILDTLVNGCLEGSFVLRLTRPDRSFRTFWRTMPDDVALKDSGLEVVLPEAAELSEVPSTLLAKGALPGLWQGDAITVKNVLAYFGGGHTVSVPKETYEETVIIPKAERAVVEVAIGEAVKNGALWLTNGPASVLFEPIPAGLLTDTAVLQTPPAPVPTTDLLPEALPEAWGGGVTTGIALSAALSAKAGKTLPWTTVRQAVDGALRARLLERAADSGAWPCDLAGASALKLRVPTVQPPIITPPPVTTPKPGVLVAEAELQTGEIQNLAEVVGDIIKAAAGYDLKFRLTVELGGKTKPPAEVVEKVNTLLKEVAPQFRIG
ncbi:MAG: DUF499 domain-containing protein [Chloroflexi bacterium]|nr:DUF499 domain-containing protein [Chloroflexota bacterium]